MHYWSLTKHLFRYNRANAGSAKHGQVNEIHTANEHIAFDVFLEISGSSRRRS